MERRHEGLWEGFSPLSQFQSVLISCKWGCDFRVVSCCHNALCFDMYVMDNGGPARSGANLGR